MIPKTIEWVGDASGYLRLLDQTRLPTETVFVDCKTPAHTFEAIRALRVRGAPAIGVSAAYGLLLGVQEVRESPRGDFDRQLEKTADFLADSRPTAVNLFWALDRMKRVASENAELFSDEIFTRLMAEAVAIQDEDRAMCAAMGEHGSPLLADCTGVLTHCNTGSLATAGDGTALAVIFAAAKNNPKLQVYADETRPLLQGARLTSWELMQRDIPCTLICDSAAAWVMKEKRVQAVITGSDRIAANGDAANKIGTYSVALLAKAHGIPFYVAAPSSTFDMTLPTGESIPIEQRKPEEVTKGFGKQTAPTDVHVYNPAFDVTPHELIAGIVTERGVISPVNAETVKAHF